MKERAFSSLTLRLTTRDQLTMPTIEQKLEPLHTDWDSIPVRQVQEGIQRQMVVGKNVMICRFRFAPKLVTPAHDHPHEQMTLIQRGRVLFTIGDEQKIVKAGDVLHIPSGTWHGATMLDEEVVLIDVFSPVREDFLT